MAALALGGDRGGDAIERLRRQKAELMEQKKQVTNELRSERRKRQRIMVRARALSNEELAAVIGARAVAQAKAKAKAKARARVEAGRGRIDYCGDAQCVCVGGVRVCVLGGEACMCMWDERGGQGPMERATRRE